jgi:hypothetical protein
MSEILEWLRGGDLRSIGRSEEVVKAVLETPALFDEVIAGMTDDDPLIRMRASDAVEKITKIHPEMLTSHKEMILNTISKSEQKEVRWHVAQILPRLDLTEEEIQTAIGILRGYLGDDSRIVRTFAMDALVGFVEDQPEMKLWVLELVEGMIEDGSPAMKSRGKKLLARLRKG